MTTRPPSKKKKKRERRAAARHGMTIEQWRAVHAKPRRGGPDGEEEWLDWRAELIR